VTDNGAAGEPHPLPGPRDEADAERMERQARDAERRIDQAHRDADPEDRPIHEE
jgi:hypothetical protein